MEAGKKVISCERCKKLVVNKLGRLILSVEAQGLDKPVVQLYDRMESTVSSEGQGELGESRPMVYELPILTNTFTF